MGGFRRAVVGFAVGVGIGALAGTLLAPASAEEMQRLVRQRIADAKAAGARAETLKEAEKRAEFQRRVTREAKE
jgi:gas vesicle protein